MKRRINFNPPFLLYFRSAVYPYFQIPQIVQNAPGSLVPLLQRLCKNDEFFHLYIYCIPKLRLGKVICDNFSFLHRLSSVGTRGCTKTKLLNFSPRLQSWERMLFLFKPFQRFIIFSFQSNYSSLLF